MSQHTNSHTEPVKRFTSDELFHAIERNRGRLQAVEYACFGLANMTGNNAACIGWVIGDILSDFDRIAVTLADRPNE